METFQLGLFGAMVLMLVAVLYSIGHWVVTSGSPWLGVAGRLLATLLALALVGSGAVLLISGAKASYSGELSVFFGAVILATAFRLIRRLGW